ncbi:MAG: Rid family detoxifying hydrolase [Candidatus Thermoplasmatota archaeon]
MKKLETIETSNAPKPIGAYSQAKKIGNIIFTSGQIGIDPNTNEMKNKTIEEEIIQVIENIKAIVEAGGAKLENVIKVNIYLKDMKYFQILNEVYGKYFKNRPARTTLQVSALPKNARIEMDVVAILY